MYVTLKSFSEGKNVINVRIWIEEIPNRLAAVSKAELRCTCKEFISKSDCTHIHQSTTPFRRWLAAETRILQQKVMGGEPLSVVEETINVALGYPLLDSLVFEMPGGGYAIQNVPSSAKAYAKGCGWGTGGKEVKLVETWPMVGMLHILKEEPDFPLSSYAFEKHFLFPTSPMPLPPSVFSDIERNTKPSTRGMATGLIDLFDEEETQVVDLDGAKETIWAKFWTAALGLRLESDDLIGEGKYLPEYSIAGEPVGAMAIDLAKGSLKLIPASKVDQLIEGIPPKLMSTICHAHLPWGAENKDTLAYQVIVKHPTLNRIVRTEPVEVLTTNLWAFSEFAEGAWPDEIHELFAQVAEILIRIGHSQNAILYHSTERMPLNVLAEASVSAENGGAFDVTPRAWELLREKVIPDALKGNEVCMTNTNELGPDWFQLVPPKE